MIQECLNGTYLSVGNGSRGGVNDTEQIDQSGSSSDDDMQNFMIGLCLAVISSVFTGSSFIYKKLGLIRYARKVGVRAGRLCLFHYLFANSIFRNEIYENVLHMIKELFLKINLHHKFTVPSCLM